MLNKFIDARYIDDTTGLLGYATWDNLNVTDPEVDSPYLTCYAIIADLIGDVHFIGTQTFLLSLKGKTYINMVKKYIAYDSYSTNEMLLRRFPRAGQNYMYGKEKFRPKEAHFNNPWNLSGDNTLPIIIAMGELGMTYSVKKLLKTHVKRLFFYQNYYTNNGVRKFLPDFMLPHLSIFIRSLHLPKMLSYIILYFTDVMLLVNILIHVVYSQFKKDNTASELNFYFSLVQAQRFNPTLWSLIAKYIYKMRGKIYKDEPRIHGALKEFFTIRGDKRPPMHIHLRAVTKLYFGE